ncbi:MAG: methionine synthase [Bacteroides sp.]|nr:methionine synthase [Bacteroides sp.]
MIQRELTFDQLGLTDAEIYEQMGYGTARPDEMTVSETADMLGEIRRMLRPQFCFFITDGELAIDTFHLSAMGHDFNIGRIIARQLRGSQRYAFFIATAGMEFENLQHRLMADGDMVKVFIADAIGSVIAEKTADRMEEELQGLLSQSGWHHTNRFSPGYCGWHVSEQQSLFPLFQTEKPCGVTLSESSLMTPIKSVSGVIGLGPEVKKLEYSCGICDFKQCYKRRLPRRKDK